MLSSNFENISVKSKYMDFYSLLELLVSCFHFKERCFISWYFLQNHGDSCPWIFHFWLYLWIVWKCGLCFSGNCESSTPLGRSWKCSFPFSLKRVLGICHLCGTCSSQLKCFGVGFSFEDLGVFVSFFFSLALVGFFWCWHSLEMYRLVLTIIVL